MATADADLTALKQNPKLAEALGQSGNPMAALLFGGIAETARNSSWLSLALRIDGQSLAVTRAADGKPGASSAFMTPAEGAGPCRTWPCRGRSPA